MREIKFRVWNDKNKQFDYWGFIDKCFYGVTTGGSLDLETVKELSEQFTGLKDKHGKEIYEGDIVVKKDYDYDSQEYQEYLECDELFDDEFKKNTPMEITNKDIVTMDRFPIYWLRQEAFGWEGEDLQTPGEYEIIGNIHEPNNLDQ